MGMFDRPYRPRVSLKMTPLEKVIEIAALAGMVCNLIIFAYYWPKLPEAAAGVSGLSINQANIFIIVTMLPVIVYLGATLFGMFPKWFNYPVRITDTNAPRQYRLAANMMRYMKAEVTLCMLIIEWVFVQIGMGEDMSFSPFFIPIFIGMLIVTLAYFLFEMFKQK
ncbi:MAG: hypothetical protein WBZ29_14620 [Methanocella sp.]